MSTRVRGEYGLVSRECGRISERQVEAGLKTRRQILPRTVKVWSALSRTIEVTRKPRGSRMGKGKGAVEYRAARVHRGTKRYEVRGVSERVAKEALTKAGSRRPVRTKVVSHVWA